MSKGHRNLQVSAHQPGVVVLAASLWVKLTACPVMGKSLGLEYGFLQREKLCWTCARFGLSFVRSRTAQNR